MGVPEKVFDYILINLRKQIDNTRNIHFEYTKNENELRKMGRKKNNYLSIENRLCMFLYQMNYGGGLWEAALVFGTNPSYASRDRKHILVEFVSRFDGLWIKQMDREAFENSRKLIGINNAAMSLDGKHFARRRRKKLAPGQYRKEYYGFKHKEAEVENVQNVTNAVGISTLLITKVPGAMNDASASVFVSDKIKQPNSILVDAGYPKYVPAFMPPLGDDHPLAERHKNKRTGLSEHAFGYVAQRWKIVGKKYEKQSDFHSLTIRAAFILQNMLLCFNEGIHKVTK